VNEMTGDGVMALFGAPIALEDAPQRAIRSAMAIHREMTRFNERMPRRRGRLPGEDAGGIIPARCGGKHWGTTSGWSSRPWGIQSTSLPGWNSLAETGTTYISEDTFKLTEGVLPVEALGEKEIKG